MAVADNVTTNQVVTFTSDSWNTDPKGSSQVPISKIMWGSRDTTYTIVDDITSQRLPVKVGEPLPAGSNNIGTVGQASPPWSVSQSGAPWSVSQSGVWNFNLPNNAATETGGNLATIATNTGNIDTDIKATQPRNIAQFGGSAVQTGVGAAGAGVPRVTLSNDSIVNIAIGGTAIPANSTVPTAVYLDDRNTVLDENGILYVNTAVDAADISTGTNQVNQTALLTKLVAGQPVNQQGAWNVGVTNFPASPSNLALESAGQLQKISDLLELILTEARVSTHLIANLAATMQFTNVPTDDPDGLRNDFHVTLQ